MQSYSDVTSPTPSIAASVAVRREENPPRVFGLSGDSASERASGRHVTTLSSELRGPGWMEGGREGDFLSVSIDMISLNLEVRTTCTRSGSYRRVTHHV